MAIAISSQIFNEREFVLGIIHVSKQYGCAKVGLNDLILLDLGNIFLDIVRYLLLLSDIVEY